MRQLKKLTTRDIQQQLIFEYLFRRSDIEASQAETHHEQEKKQHFPSMKVFFYIAHTPVSACVISHCRFPCRVVEEEVQVPYTVKEVVNVPVTRKETVPRVVTQQVEQTVTVPVVKEVPVTRQVEVPTGK